MKYWRRLDLSGNKKRKKPEKNRTYLSSFRYAFEGVRTVFQEERNMRSHSFSMLGVLIVSLFLNLVVYEWLWILLVCFLMLVMEIWNTVIENMVDLVSPHYHPLAKKVKDMAAAAVLLTSAFSVVVGSLILIPKILKLLNII